MTYRPSTTPTEIGDAGVQPDLSVFRVRDLVEALWSTRSAVEGHTHVIQSVPYRHVETTCDQVREELTRRRREHRDHAQAQLKKFSTRYLLVLLDAARACGGWYCYSDPAYCEGCGYSYADLKIELNTREHVPNKHEGHALRREAATMHHGPRRKR